MDFSKLRHRIIFLYPGDLRKNSMGETVPGYVPFRPPLPSSFRETGVFLTHDTDGSAVLNAVTGRHILIKKRFRTIPLRRLCRP